MGWWSDQVVPRMVDLLLRSDDVDRLRASACDGLHGDVLEIGFGSGLNCVHYPAAVRSVTAIEPSDVAWRLAQPRIDDSPVPVVRSGPDGQRLGLPDLRFDSALTTFTMCTIPDLDQALHEVARVLRPGGRLHFVEHGRSVEPGVARWQDRLQPLQHRIAGGCHLNRPIAEHLSRSGLRLTQLEEFYDRGPKFLSYIYLGSAEKPATSA